MTPAKSRVAKALNSTEAEALEFISLARARLGWPAKHAWIARCLEEYPDVPRTPEGVAAKLGQLSWAVPPEERTRIPRPSVSKAQKRRARKPSRVPRARNRQYSPPSEPWPTRETVKPDTFDKTHVPVGKLSTCPHGVPKTSLCAICNPKKFAKEGDSD